MIRKNTILLAFCFLMSFPSVMMCHGENGEMKSAQAAYTDALGMVRDEFIVTFSRSGMLEYSKNGEMTNTVFYRGGKLEAAFFLDRNTILEIPRASTSAERTVFGRSPDGEFWRVELSRPYRDVVLTSRAADGNESSTLITEIDGYEKVLDQIRSLGVLMLSPDTIRWKSDSEFEGSALDGQSIRCRVTELAGGKIRRIAYELPSDKSSEFGVEYSYDDELPGGIPSSMRLYNSGGDLGVITILDMSRQVAASEFSPESFLVRNQPQFDAPVLLFESNKVVYQNVLGRLEPVTSEPWGYGQSRPAWQNWLVGFIITGNVGLLLLYQWWRRRRINQN